MRTHTCGQLNQNDVGKSVSLCGWLYSVRDLGAVIFATLRDFYGVTQFRLDGEEIKQQLRAISRESVLRVSGKVVLRLSPNPAMPTGLIEIEPENIEVLGKCVEQLPFEIASSLEMREDMRLKYRFLDLRNPLMRDKIVLRSKIVSSIRRRMTDKGFLEIATPILTSSSPEGSRDFIVPSRLHPGKFYALPQAPQQYKQLLMTSGIDRYFQIAPCFRDEDARADRSPGEFYQLDMEMAFATQEDVFATIEDVIAGIFREFSTFKVDSPFPRLTFAECMRDYGTDKPDLRNPLKIKNITELCGGISLFNGDVYAVAVNNFDKPRSFIDKTIIEQARQNEIENVYWLKTDEHGELVGGAAKFFADKKSALLEALGLKNNGFAAFVCGKNPVKHAGILRNILGRELGILEKDVYRFCWVVDFPMFELDDDGKIAFSHNPFSMPQGGMGALKNIPPLQIKAYQYDIVCNGYELSSGAVRNHDPEIMVEAFKIAGYDKSVIEEKFSALYNAFKFGAPPHAGIAPGVDRIVMLLAGEECIREVIAYPMDKSARDLLMNAPSTVTQKQLDEANIAIKLKSEK